MLLKVGKTYISLSLPMLFTSLSTNTLLLCLHIKFPDVITKEMLHWMTTGEDVAQTISIVNKNSVLQDYNMFLVLLKF